MSPNVIRNIFYFFATVDLCNMLIDIATGAYVFMFIALVGLYFCAGAINEYGWWPKKESDN